MNNKRCVIIGGAEIHNYQRIKEKLRDDDFCIFCDCGLNHQKELGVQPALIIGDFDSYTQEVPEQYAQTEIIRLPCEKYDTDTVYAAKEGLKRGFTDFFLIGAVGNRFDHSLANTAILLMLHNAGAHGILIDDYSEMEVVGNKAIFIPPSYYFFSLMAVFGSVKGLSIKYAKYPLKHAELHAEYQYAISNETIGKTAEVTVEEGCLLLIKITRAS